MDLGHRFAAACAVWEALSASDFAAEISGRAVVSGGTSRADLYLHSQHKDENGKERTTIYRRIGSDNLPDESVHPAPWARLDRQFLIKLQGEDRSARNATKEEQDQARQMEESFGRSQEEGETPPKQVDELMSRAVRASRLALKRHGDRARITFAMTAAYKPMPGDRQYFFPPDHVPDGFGDTPEQRKQMQVESIQDALLLWHRLFSSKGWQDQGAKELWQQCIAPLPGYNSPESIAEDSSGPERKKKRKENFDKLRGATESLVQNADMRSQLHDEWKRRWDCDDQAWLGHLRQLQDWVRPAPSKGAQAIRHVGGLSLMRLATLTELRRKVQVGFFTRLHPNGKKEETKEQFGQRTLDAIESMREQRVKQLASRIVEAALGMGRMRPSAGRDIKRPRASVDKSCHAVVIESLRNYRPDDLQTRRENRALMDWSSGKVRKYLEEACQLYGLHLREVPPNYTSKQCSRTGLPGIRCADVTVGQFQSSPFWRKVVKSSQKRIAQGGKATEDIFFSDLETKVGGISAPDAKKKMLLRLPRKGGDLFVAAPSRKQLNEMSGDSMDCKASKGALQADLNAAANIGLRALLDPDYSATWWYVPCSTKDGRAAQDKVKGSACFENTDVPFLNASEKSAEKRDIFNAWRDPSAISLSQGTPWSDATKYWNHVRARAVEALHRFNERVIANHSRPSTVTACKKHS